MTIEQYKEEFKSLTRKMENEFGCAIDDVSIERYPDEMSFGGDGIKFDPSYSVTITF